MVRLRPTVLAATLMRTIFAVYGKFSLQFSIIRQQYFMYILSPYDDPRPSVETIDTSEDKALECSTLSFRCPTSFEGTLDSH